MQRQTRPPIGFHFLIESTVRFSFLVLLLVYGIMSNNTLLRSLFLGRECKGTATFWTGQINQ